MSDITQLLQKASGNIHQRALSGIPRFIYQKTGVADTDWATHSEGAQNERRGTVAVAVRVDEGLDDAGFATFRKKFLNSKNSAFSQGSVVRVSAEGMKHNLALNVDLNDGNVLKSEGADTTMQVAPLSVNGVALK